jgi:hypothetical protein
MATYRAECKPMQTNDIQFLEDLRSRYNAGEKMKYVFFWGHQPGKVGVTASCFSQWYDSPFVVDGQTYLTAEHYMMASKARLFGDTEICAQILVAPNPGAASRSHIAWLTNVAAAVGERMRLAAGTGKTGASKSWDDYTAGTSGTRHAFAPDWLERRHRLLLPAQSLQGRVQDYRDQLQHG